ncbi:sensor histidine kinase [Streptomyces sp. NPDC060194]|uniref:sensor histidine kinase n=1 Tax=Streptomyces sp. NPDC060194 TaxID=3347069 RepID=UPI003664F1C8
MRSAPVAHRVAACAVLAVSWGLAAAALVARVRVEVPWANAQWYVVVDAADAVVYGLVAAVVLRRRLHPVGWLVALTAVGGGAAGLAGALALRYPVDAVPPAWTLLQSVAWVPGTLALMLVIPYLVTDGHRPRPLGRALALTGGGLVIAGTLVTRLTDPWPWPGAPETFSPFAIRDEGWARIVMPLNTWIMGAAVVLGLVAAAYAAHRRRRDPRARGLGWLAIGTALLTLTFVPLVLWPEDGGGPHLELFTPLTHLASQAFFPAAVLVAVLGQRLWGIDLAVSRTLVWSLLTGMLVSGYFLIVAALGLVLPGEGTLSRVVATAAPAALVQPLRGWLQRRVDRLVYGEGATPALSRVGRRLSAGADTPRETLAGMAESVAASFNLGAVRVLDAAGGAVVTVGAPGPRGELTDVPLVVGGEPAGALHVWPRPGERLDRRARAALAEVAPVVASAVHLAAVTEALRESRGRLAAARDDERRLLRRELHDQIGPALAGIGLGLAAVRNLPPEAADPLLVRLRAEVDARVEEVRVLARGLVPPVLAELGLLPALRELVMRYEADGLAVVVRADGDPPEPAPEVAGAVYAVVAEAARNVARHSGARTCVVELRRTADAGLVVTVEDDGRGIDDATVRPGVGTTSVRERAEGVGGTVAWGPGRDGRGTRLTLRVPDAGAAADVPGGQAGAVAPPRTGAHDGAVADVRAGAVDRGE